MATSHMTAQLGRVLGGRYRLVAPLGSGASAQVYLAEDVTLQRRVAVKILHPALAGDDAFLRRFGAEARAAAALSHPNVMAVYDWGEDEGPYLVMEHLGGGSLRAMLDTGVRLSVAQSLAIGIQAAQALDAAHRRGFVHRDVKPANLVFGDDGRLRIADFGLTRALAEAAWTEPGDGLVGTARYAAPEQASTSRIDGKADIYALGLVLIEGMTGAVPLTADTNLGTLMVRVDRQVPVPQSAGPMREVLERCGRPDPADRPEASELVTSFLEAARELDPPDPLPLAGAVEPSALAAMEAADPTLHATGVPSPDDGDPTVSVPRASDGDGPTDRTAMVPVVDAGDPRRATHRRWPLAVGVLLALLVVGALVAFAYVSTRPPSAALPDLSMMTEAEARTALAEAEAGGGDELSWNLEFVGEVSERVNEGVVIRQDPGPGTMLADGGTATVVVSEGPPIVPVPALDGRTVEEATADLEGADLGLGDVTERHDEQVPVDAVVEWSVDGEVRPTEARKGSEVDLVLSSGPAPREVPELAGQTVESARRQLEELGLVVGDEEVEYSESVEEGRVIATEPAAGATAPRGAEVEVRVSRGPQPVSIPDIIRDRLDDAVGMLRSAGLNAGDVSGRATGRVRETSPPVGSRVEPGTEVDLELR